MNALPRKPTKAELPALAQLWYDGWHAAHAAHVPASLTAIRTLDSFHKRLENEFECIRTLGDVGAPLGLCMVRKNEIYQMYVTNHAQGTGAASALIRDGEHRIRQAGHEQAFLDVIPENARAIAFYEKMGWQKQAVQTVMLDTLTDPYPLSCLVMIKNL